MKRPILIIISVMVLALVAYAFIHKGVQEVKLPDNVKNLTFTISGIEVTLDNGLVNAITNLGGDTDTEIKYFGDELVQDVDGDGVDDTVFLITQKTKAGNLYFYLVAGLKRGDGYEGSQAVLIGDRIAPQTVEKGPGRQVIVNFATRKPGQDFSAAPSVGKSIYLLLDPKTLEFGEVVQGFEGEAK